jgi:hypothetical protein
MSNRTDSLSRGDEHRNQRRLRLREIVSRDRAIAGLDLADTVQELAVVDHDGRCLPARG